MVAAMAARSRRSTASANTRNISPWVTPLAPRWNEPGAPSAQAPSPEPSHISGRPRRDAFGYTQPASVPRNSTAAPLATMCSSEPCSSGAVRMPNRPRSVPGCTANRRASKPDCAA